MSVLRVKRKRAQTPKNGSKRTKDGDAADAMKESETVEKPEGRSARDQSGREGQKPGRQMSPELADRQDGPRAEAGDDVAEKARWVQHAMPALPTPESAAIAAKRAQLQAALRDRPRWMARPAPAAAAMEPPPVQPEPDPAVETVGKLRVLSVEIVPNSPETAPEPAAEPYLVERTVLDDDVMSFDSRDEEDVTITPYSPPSWKASIDNYAQSTAQRLRRHEPVAFIDHAQADAISRDEEPADEASYVEDAFVSPVHPQDHASEDSGEDEEPPHVFAEPPAMFEPRRNRTPAEFEEPSADFEESPAEFEQSAAEYEHPAAEFEATPQVFAEPSAMFERPRVRDTAAMQEARRRFLAAYDVYRSPNPLPGANEEPQELAEDPQAAADHGAHGPGPEGFHDSYDEPQQAPTEFAEPPRPAEGHRRLVPDSVPRSDPFRMAPRRSQPFEGASSNVREAIDTMNARGRATRHEALRRSVAAQHRPSRSMSGIAVAAALLMSACGGVAIYGWKAGGLDALLAFLPDGGPAQSEMVADATPAEETAPETTAATDAKPAGEAPVVIEAVTTAEGPTGALPEANKEESPAAQAPPSLTAEMAPPAETAPPPANHDLPAPEANLPGADAATPPVTAKSVASKKRFHTARLNVNDVEGVEQQYIPLNLTMDNGQSPGEIELRLSGLPEAATLSAGEKLADGAWVVTAKDTDNLRVMAPDIDKPERHTVAVEAVETQDRFAGRSHPGNAAFDPAPQGDRGAGRRAGQ